MNPKIGKIIVLLCKDTILNSNIYDGFTRVHHSRLNVLDRFVAIATEYCDKLSCLRIKVTLLRYVKMMDNSLNFFGLMGNWQQIIREIER